MTKHLVAIISALLLSGAAAYAADDAKAAAPAKWPDFKSIDTDGNGRISRAEWAKASGNLKMDPAPTFEAMDEDSNNGIDDDEWAAAEKTTLAYSKRCREADKSWCHDFK